MVAVQTIMLDHNEDEIDTLKFFQRTSLGFCIKLNHMLLTISHNFGGGQKELFKRVVVQNALWTREEKLSVGLKIFHE